MIKQSDIERKKKKVLSSFETNKILSQYANLYLLNLSNKTLYDWEEDSLIKHIKERFDFFKSSINKEYNFKISKHPKPSKRKDHHRFELVCHDAPHLLITLEELFRNLDLKMVKKIHPIVSVTLTPSGTISAIDKASSNAHLVSDTYIEFIGTDDTSQLDLLTKKIDESLQAIQVTSKDKKNINKKVYSLIDMLENSKQPIWKNQEEWGSLLHWLLNDNFSFFGYIELESSAESKAKANPKTGLGLLNSTYLKKNKYTHTDLIESHSWKERSNKNPFTFDTIAIPSLIQRFENLMHLRLKIPSKTTGTVTEHIIIGMLRRTSLLAKNIETPLIHLKMEHIFEAKNMLHGSYNYNEVIRIFTSIPKFELFRTHSSDLLLMVENLLSITNPNEVSCFTWKTHSNKRTFLLVAIPSFLFTNHNIELITSHILKTVKHTSCEIIKASGIETSRLHVYFDQEKSTKLPDTSNLETTLTNIIKPWETQLFDELMLKFPIKKAKDIYKKYLHAFPEHHRLRRSPIETVRDIMYLEKLEYENKSQFNIVPFNFKNSVLSGKASVLFIYKKEKTDLINSMPILQNLGIYVYDELATRIGAPDNIHGYIHAFRIVDANQQKINEEAIRDNLVNLLSEIFEGNIENDPLNALTIKEGLNWKQIKILQLYRNLALQISAAFSKQDINKACLTHSSQVKDLISFFETKFSPNEELKDPAYRESHQLPKLKKQFYNSLQSVSDVSEDLMLQRLFKLMEATVRTNYFIDKPTENSYLSIKLNSSQIAEMPTPVPFREIYVYDTLMEGTHLRFGKVARGGLRWSDRYNDFRSEVLGLVKTQQTKNVVIVPEGSKGGFIIKKTFSSREEMAAESQKHYQRFISGLLELTDNVDAKGQIQTPPNVLRYDDQDPYLVVAADKGTAQFSDFANDTSRQFNFWLDDAFASGGSNGYNHKEVGITAKGAWECTKIHFKELGKDIQTEPFTVAGVGDMSGDVFGNGMLLSKQIKLVAAFNHMHIFLDPDPKPEESWNERSRIFNLPRSTWEDYDKSLISKGGGIFSRKAKEIQLSPEIQKLLGITKKVLNGEELIKAILKMNVELIWLGGIGTYFKDKTQSHLEAKDPANDSVRVDIQDIKAKVIGEGANLGLTQEARYSFDLQGGKINTDFIDNSAGVNMSDYEVNLKILLQLLKRKHKVTSEKERNNLLRKATDQVTELVLKNNRYQHRLISMDQQKSKQQVFPFIKLSEHLIDNGLLDPKSEKMPSKDLLKENFRKGIALPRPFLALLQSFSKMHVYKDLIQSPLLKNNEIKQMYIDYFPELFSKSFLKELDEHHLKNEILCTTLTNHVINLHGSTTLFEIKTLTSTPYDIITTAFLIVEKALNYRDIRTEIIHSKIDEAQKYILLLYLEKSIKTMVTNLLQLPGFECDFKIAEKCKEIADNLISSKQLKAIPPSAIQTILKKSSLSNTTRQIITQSEELPLAIDLLFLSKTHKGTSFKPIISIIETIDSSFKFDFILSLLKKLSLTSQWEETHREVLAQNIRLLRLHLAEHCTRHFKVNNKEIANEDILSELESKLGNQLKTYKNALEKLHQSDEKNLSSLSVTISRLNFNY